MIQFANFEKTDNGAWCLTDIREPLPQFRALVCNLARGTTRAAEKRGTVAAMVAVERDKPNRLVCGSNDCPAIGQIWV